MEIKVTRTFNAVGQGAFYCESFEVLGNRMNIVYDCGTNSKKKYLEREIKSRFKKGEIIDALFISHLHDDHVNGIPILLNYCQVKKIIFPIISNSSYKVMLKIKAIQEDETKFTIKLIENTINAISELVDYSNEIKYIGVNAIGAENRPRENNNQIEIVSSGTDVVESINFNLNEIWSYIPFNFQNPENLSTLINKLLYLGINVDELEKMDSNKWTNQSDILKKAYKAIPGNFNAHSMVLYSGEKEMYRSIHRMHRKYRKYRVHRMDGRMEELYYNKDIVFYNECFDEYFDDTINIGCLYTGDYNASNPEAFKDLKARYEEYWPYIGCVQIPHHGSKDSYNPMLIGEKQSCVISAGKKNRYNHPDSQVINDILLRDGILFIVTEDAKSRLVEYFHIIY